jgi:hypothetical protein
MLSTIATTAAMAEITAAILLAAAVQDARSAACFACLANVTISRRLDSLRRSFTE